VLPQPREGIRVVGAERENVGRDWDQRVQVEGASAAAADPRDSNGVAALDGFAELAREHAGAG
jgi:hypothetical protein